VVGRAEVRINLGPMRERQELLYVGEGTRRAVRGKRKGTAPAPPSPASQNKQFQQIRPYVTVDAPSSPAASTARLLLGDS
jgi:hypothetical protein